MSEFKVSLDGQEIETSLQDIAGFDIAGIQEDSGDFFRAPRGKYRFKVVNAAIEAMGDTPAAVVELEIVHCFGTIAAPGEDEIDPATLHGQKARFPYFLNDMKKGIGQLIFLMNHSGFAMIAGGDLKTQLDGFCGTVFDGLVSHGKNKNDPDKPYVRLDLKSVTPPAA